MRFYYFGDNASYYKNTGTSMGIAITMEAWTQFVVRVLKDRFPVFR